MELFNSVGSALGKYAIQNKVLSVISLGPQPAKDLTAPTPELFNSLGVVFVSYAQKQHMGGCSEHQGCTATLSPASNAAQESKFSDLELFNSVARALVMYALKNNIPLDIQIGPQPTRDLTTPTPELFNAFGGAIMTYAQRHHMGGCSESQGCTLTLSPSVIDRIQVWIESILGNGDLVTVPCFGILMLLVCVALRVTQRHPRA